jgi:hypothetical protein
VPKARSHHVKVRGTARFDAPEILARLGEIGGGDATVEPSGPPARVKSRENLLRLRPDEPAETRFE